MSSAIELRTSIAHAHRRVWPSLGRSPRPLAGFDIHDQGVVMALALATGSLEFSDHARFWLSQVTLPAGAVAGAEIIDEAAVVEAIDNLISHAPAAPSACAMAIPAQAAISRVIDLPAELSDEAAQAQVELAVCDLIAQPRADIALDFMPLTSADPASRQQPWLLLAAKQAWIAQRQGLAEQLDVPLQRVDWSACATLRLLGQTHPECAWYRLPAAVWLHCDEGQTLLTVMRHGWPVQVEWLPSSAHGLLAQWLQHPAQSPLQDTHHAIQDQGPWPLYVSGSGGGTSTILALTQAYEGPVHTLSIEHAWTTLVACGLAMAVH